MISIRSGGSVSIRVRPVWRALRRLRSIRSLRALRRLGSPMVEQAIPQRFIELNDCSTLPDIRAVF